jgi:hypothetical protein
MTGLALLAGGALLPLAAGCETFVAGDVPSGPVADLLNLETVTETTALDHVTRRIDSLERSRPPGPAVDEQFVAGIQAARLVEQVRSRKMAGQTRTNGPPDRQDHP